eukprot:12205573-Heterocapsa_arctica.AAC.1
MSLCWTIQAMLSISLMSNKASLGSWASLAAMPARLSASSFKKCCHGSIVPSCSCASEMWDLTLVMAKSAG